ncbi:protein TPX2 isoform X1 [Daucus carota subsp. sativus]|uniref:protein TPX2 isoform X1 n=1 Tax=Daucus carota subsp. sativus TaxID=79200 RepID=UPI0007F02FCC|nr:PREDICTED: protein TPX2 isoform X1 [Daucus carota subsp. sativus]
MATLSESYNNLVIDEVYEFSAPRFFDFIQGETKEEMHRAEIWFETSLSHAPSPFMPKIKTSRTAVLLESLCDFSEADQPHKVPESLKPPPISGSETVAVPTLDVEQTIPQPDGNPVQVIEEVDSNGSKETQTGSLLKPASSAIEITSKDKETLCTQGNESAIAKAPSPSVKVAEEAHTLSSKVGPEACTPKPQISQKCKQPQTDSKKQMTARKIASMVRNPSLLKAKTQPKISSQAKSNKPESARRNNNFMNKLCTPNFAQENQPIKRQKLDAERSRQILNIKPQTLMHKTRSGLVSSSSSLCTSTNKTRKEDRKIYAREPAAPFVSMAEMMNKFQSNTRDMSLSRPSSSLACDAAGPRKPKLTLTRPKEPEFETSQRVRSVKIKSSAELEEELMAKIPKFKARPINKKILETPTLPALPRSNPQLPKFQEFHLETMTRANNKAETSTVASTESAPQNAQSKPHHLTEPKPPTLQTSLRARPPRIKSSEELEKEELEKIPRFKARPLNKKIFESKGELGVFCNTKRQVTIPQEFHFAIDERIPPPTAVADLFDKLSLNTETRHDKQLPRNTAPNPFHLHTEERGAKKENKLVMELLQKQLEEEKSRVPKANPYPYTTDYPVLPPKPEPKPCTKPEPFQLESLVRHEEELQREMEERQRMEREEARMRLFKAQPVMKEDPIPVPEKVRKPLTEVQEFDLHVEHRAVERAEFDKKVKEKEVIYKRYREEAESEKLMEEEKALKQLRRTLVPHARPVPNFANPFLPQKSCKVTKAKSPKLKIRERKERQHNKMLATATSSAASNMR